jgi:uncharacterized protein (TIGR02452 family)
MSGMSSRLRAIARDTVEVTERGWYRVDGSEVRIDAAVKHAVDGTRLYLPEDPLPETAPVSGSASVEVTGETTLAALDRLGGDGLACLVFASARNPGGGFRNGAQAQEESLARGSALYPCLLAAPDFYAHHRAEPDLCYSDRVIHSPAVPVFRDDAGAFRAVPLRVSFLTAAAPNRSAVSRNQPASLPSIPAVLARRASRVLAVAAAHGYRRLLLGAWGCGVFGNDPDTVAGAFATALSAAPWFTHVTFAVLDPRPGAPTRTAFTRAFAGAAA